MNKEIVQTKLSLCMIIVFVVLRKLINECVKNGGLICDMNHQLVLQLISRIVKKSPEKAILVSVFILGVLYKFKYYFVHKRKKKRK